MRASRKRKRPEEASILRPGGGTLNYATAGVHVRAPHHAILARMASAASPPGLRISLREFLLLFIAFAIGFAALAFANSWWLAAVSGVALLAFIAALIIALIDRGRRQVFALGFAASVLTYAPLFLLGNDTDPFTGNLPTSRLLQPMHLAVRQQSYRNVRTDEEVSEQELPAGALVEGMTAFPTYSSRNAARNSASYFVPGNSTPALEHFMPIGHCQWALLFGYAGGQFARWVYARRLREQATTNEVAAG